LSNGSPAVLVYIFRQPGANIVDTVDRVQAILPQLKASIPAAIDVRVLSDRTTTIRASVRDVQRTMAISMGLVIMVVFVFLRSVRTTLIPAVAVPVSLVGHLRRAVPVRLQRGQSFADGADHRHRIRGR
jgi:multidrug efflux pump